MATTATARPKNDSLNGNGRGRGGVPQDAEISIDDSIKAAITDSAPINIILADTDLRIVYMNEASRRTLKTIENLLPCRVDEIVGKSVDEFHENPSYQRGILRNYKDLPRQAQIKLGDQILDLLVSATYDSEGNYTGPMVTWAVITEKVELERRNADVTNQLAAIDRNQAVIEFQMDGTIVKANENFLRTVGYSMDEIKGQHHRMFCEDSFTRSPEYKEFWARLNRGEYNAGEFKRIGKGGKEVWIQASYNAIADVNGKLVKVVKFASDITEVVKARQRQAELEEQEKKAQEELKRKVDELLRVVDAASKGDLTREITVSGTDAVGQLAGGLSKMFTDLRDIIGQIVESGAQFSEGARVIAESSQALASGAQTQSAAVEEVSASVDQLTKQIEGVKGSANQANELAQSTSKLAQDGGDAVGKSVEAMDLIKKSSEQISEIIQVISEIASQTNLLALNAAIEAARAGEHGLGFAVVADEVRKLAERSSSAAKEISSLIRESTKRVDAGAELSSQTGDALRRIVEGVASTAAKISEIADATAEQATSAQEVSQAVQEIGKVTEQAAASSEELASSSEELGAQSAVLKETVARFKV